MSYFEIVDTRTSEEREKQHEETLQNIAWAYRMDTHGNIIFVNQQDK